MATTAPCAQDVDLRGDAVRDRQAGRGVQARLPSQLPPHTALLLLLLLLHCSGQVMECNKLVNSLYIIHERLINIKYNYLQIYS